jgi:hypothetical protein
MKHIILLLLARLFVPPTPTSLQLSKMKIGTGMDHRYNESEEKNDHIIQRIIEIHEKQKLLRFLENDSISFLQKLEQTKESGIILPNLIAGGLTKDWDFNM